MNIKTAVVITDSMDDIEDKSMCNKSLVDSKPPEYSPFTIEAVSEYSVAIEKGNFLSFHLHQCFKYFIVTSV